MFGWEFPPHITGGLGTACAGIVDALARAGHEITLVLPDAVRPRPSPNVTFRRVRVGDAPARPCAYDASSYSGVHSAYPAPVRCAGVGAYAPYDHAYRAPYGTVWPGRLAVAVSTFGRQGGGLSPGIPFEVIHCHDWLTFPAGLRAREWSRKPLLLQVHSLESDRNGTRANRYIEALEHEALASADHIVAVSRYLRDRIRAEHGIPDSMITVIPNGAPAVARSRARPPARLAMKGSGGAIVSPGSTGRQERRTVLFLGRVTWQKGPGTFVEAAALARQSLPNLRFVVAGDGELLPAIKEHAHGRGIDQLFAFPGFLGREEADRLLETSDVLVMPSWSEPFGLVALEAAAHGLPVVLTARCGVRELLPWAPIVQPGDAQGFADAVVDLLTQPDAYREQALLNMRAAAESSWQRTAAELAAVYTRLVEHNAEEGPRAAGGQDRVEGDDQALSPESA